MFGALKKSLAKVGAKVIKAAKPLGKKMVKKGMKVVTNPKNQKKIMKMASSSAAFLGRGVVRRLTDDPQLSRLTEQHIKRAAIETERHLMKGKRVNGKFVRK